MMTAAAGTILLAGLATAPSASAVMPERPTTLATAKAECNTRYQVTGAKVAIRRPAWNDSSMVAKPDSPVVGTLKRGQVVKSCTTLIARTESGPAYHKCGKDGHLWRVVKGGQVPATCLTKL